MALKIENNSAVAYHIVDGAVRFPYAVDAQQAVGAHPLEWRDTPWSADDAAEARKKLGLAEPEVSDEERAAIEEHNKAVAEAQERLNAFREKQAKEKAEADQIAADEALVASPPPQVEMRRPFGRKGEPTPAEIAAMNKKKAADEKAEFERGRQAAAEKASADQLAAASITKSG